MYAFLCVFTIYLQKVYGMSPLKTGLACSSFSLAFIFSSKFIEKTITFFKNKTFIQLGFILAILDFLLMKQINLQTNLWQLILMFFLLGTAITIINAPSMTEAITRVPHNKSGIASGIIFTIRWVGGSIGAITTTLTFQMFGLKTACLSLALAASIGFICATLFIQKPNHLKVLLNKL
jgi:predicted MFS family arabinose efflux permease